MTGSIGLTAKEITERVRSGSASRFEIVREHLDYAAAVNPDVGALVRLRRPEALEEARAADEAGAHGGILDGVPVSVKAEYDVAGLPTSHGNRSLTKQIATHDSPVVARLREHGAIIIGKGNQPDFAMRWNTHSSEIGWTRNPRDLSCSVGGSSGGDAAAVAAGMVALGFGTDTAGSIRVPAAFCQVYGLRATPGRVPFASEDVNTARSPAMEAMSSQGPLARSVDDLQLAFQATAGPSAEHPFSLTAQPYHQTPTDSRCVARLVGQAGAEVAPEVVKRVDLVCEALERAGYEVEDAAFPGAVRAPELWGELLCTELRLRALPRLHDIMDPSCFDHIDKLSQVWPTNLDSDTYVARWGELTVLRRRLLQWMKKFPLVISPIAGVPLPLPLEYDHWADSDSLVELTVRMRNCLWPACLGLPALALPIGVQLIVGPHRDELLFEPARVVEATLGPCAASILADDWHVSN